MRVSRVCSPLEFVAKYCSLVTSSKQSKAPESASDSIVFLLHADKLTRSRKSKIDLYGPFALRSFTRLSTAPSPTPLMPPSPKRISPF